MKKVVLLGVLMGLFIGCEKSIPVVDPTALDDRNIYIRMYKYFDGDLLDTSAIYQINGDIIKINSIYVTLSGARFTRFDDLDTVVTESDLTMIDVTTTSEVKLAHLPRGSYNGTLTYNIGLDSARAFKAPENFEDGNPLKKGTVWNGGDIGHSFFQIEGGIFAPTDTVFNNPQSTFVWRFATPDLMVEKNEKRNFSVASNKDVFFVMNLDVEKLFLGLTPSQTPVINSDPADATDFNNAKILRDNVISEFVFEL
ncbi:MAG: hypothetical protein RLZZ599_945 [Bacteroidota bacterium]|jgi:hypothetical protein